MNALMDDVAMADAKIGLAAGMTAVLIQVDSKDELRKIFEECMPEATRGYLAELRTPLVEGSAYTREVWMRMIEKFMPALSDEEIRSFFDLMLKRAKERNPEMKRPRGKAMIGGKEPENSPSSSTFRAPEPRPPERKNVDLAGALLRGLSRQQAELDDKLARKQKFLAAVKEWEGREPEKNPERRKQKFMEFVRNYVKVHGPIELE